MNIRPIHTKADYKAALKVVSVLVDADPKRGTPDGDRLEVLGTLVEVYEAKNYPIELPAPIPAIKQKFNGRSLEIAAHGMRPIHPGEVLREEFLLPLNIKAHALSMALQVPAPRIHEIVHERRSVTVDTAMRLAKYFGTSAEFWLGLQTDYDMAIARSTMSEAMARISRCKFIAP